jgi:hypothetical protein
VRDLNLRLKHWQPDSCIADSLAPLTHSLQAYTNYANNHATILATLDKVPTII